MLYPGSAKPLYEQLKELLIQKIDSGELKAGNRLPGERALEKSFGVSRITVRQAIGELVNEGVLFRQQGRGTFVAVRRIERPLAVLQGVAEELTLEGMKVDISIIKTEAQIPPQEVIQAFNLEKGKEVFLLCRLISADGQPVLIDYSYLPYEVGYKLYICDLSKDIIYSVLESYGYRIDVADQIISSEAASLEEARYLECKPKNPVLVVRRTTFVEGQLPILFSRSVYRADRYEYRIRLMRNMPLLGTGSQNV